MGPLVKSTLPITVVLSLTVLARGVDLHSRAFVSSVSLLSGCNRVHSGGNVRSSDRPTAFSPFGPIVRVVSNMARDYEVEFVEDCNSNESAHLFGNRASKASTYRGGWRSLKLSTQNQTRWEWPLRWFREPHVIEPSEQADSAPPHSQMVLAKAKKNDLKTGVMTRICFTYMASMAMKTAIPALLPTIAVDTVLMPQEGQLTLAIGLGTLGALVGKFLLGITSDKFGATRTLKFLLLSMAAAALLASFSSSIIVFLAASMMLDFSFSGTWGCCTAIVREEFPEKDWSGKLGLMASSSRVGVILGSASFGLLLNMGFSWRQVILVVGAMQLLPVLIFRSKTHPRSLPMASGVGGPVIRGSRQSILGTDNETYSGRETLLRNRMGTLSRRGGEMKSILKEESVGKKEEGEAVIACLRRCARDANFWVMLAGKGALTIPGMFVPLLPLFLNSAYKVSPGTAASLASVFAIGGLLSNLMVANLYGRLQVREQAGLVAGNTAACTLCAGAFALQILGVVSVPLWGAVCLLFFWGFNFATPFYIPSGLFALRAGGKEHAALLSNLFDAVGYLLFFVFNSWALTAGSRGEWAPVFSSLALLLMVGGGLSVTAQLRDKTSP